MGKRFEWTDEHERKFQALKGYCTSVSQFCERIGVSWSAVHRYPEILERMKLAIDGLDDDLVSESLAVVRRNLNSENEVVRNQSAKILIDRQDKKLDRIEKAKDRDAVRRVAISECEPLTKDQMKAIDLALNKLYGIEQDN